MYIKPVLAIKRARNIRICSCSHSFVVLKEKRASDDEVRFSCFLQSYDKYFDMVFVKSTLSIAFYTPAVFADTKREAIIGGCMK